MISESKKEYLIHDLLALAASVERPQGSDPTANAHAVLRRERNAGVLDALCREPQEILIVRTENPPHLSRTPQVVRIVATQQIQIASRKGIDARKPELSGDLSGHVLVEVETKLAQREVQRPWTFNC
ncbi:MAG TPA: hypothetical protein VGG03_16095 [Thermoanaerobaculia bacterium]